MQIGTWKADNASLGGESEDFLHTKLLMSEKRILTGSCNIGKGTFTRLNELDIMVNNDVSRFAQKVRSSVDRLFREAVRVGSASDIRYNRLLATAENIMT